jgi:biotin synthase
MIREQFTKIDKGQDLTREDLETLSALRDPDELESLYRRADEIRRLQVGDEVHLRGLIEFSNVCRKNCFYCGIRCSNNNIKRYRMPGDEIMQAAQLDTSFGYRTVVLQSGEDPLYSVDMLSDLITKIKQGNDLAVTLSIGERSREEYQQLFAAGADRFLLRFETSNPVLYRRLHPDSYLEQRLQSLAWLKEIGYQVGSGIMVGLPGQTREDLAGSPSGTADLTLKVVALTRIVTGNTHIPATTALATLRPADGREKALQAGANVLMPNVTPLKYRDLYELYPAKICIHEAAEQCHTCIRQRIFSVGRPISRDHGHSFKTTAPKSASPAQSQ